MSSLDQLDSLGKGLYSVTASGMVSRELAVSILVITQSASDCECMSA